MTRQAPARRAARPGTAGTGEHGPGLPRAAGGDGRRPPGFTSPPGTSSNAIRGSWVQPFPKASASSHIV